VFFDILGAITYIETFARGLSIRELPRLRRLYGRGRWRKRKGFANARLPNGIISKSRDSLVRSLWDREKGIEDQAFPGQAMPAQKKGFAVCLRNGGFAASLEVRKLYPFINDPDAEADNLIRVVDESGEDYLYPARLFRKLALPSDIQRALRTAS
jgi:hypothetical protein